MTFYLKEIIFRALASGVGAQAAVDSLSCQLRFDQYIIKDIWGHGYAPSYVTLRAPDGANNGNDNPSQGNCAGF